MNPLTQVKRLQKINSVEVSLGISEEASWHAKYKDSAYIFIGGIPFDLTEGDLLAVFAQYGEIVDVNLVRDKGTGKSKGFAFLAYEDQRSTILAVDNLNGAKLLGRIVRVDHVSNYKRKEEEDEKEKHMREARGVCRAFQRGECTRGDSCKFSHDKHRCADTGWGARDSNARWGHDMFEEPWRSQRGDSIQGLRQKEGTERGHHSSKTEGDGVRKSSSSSGVENDDRLLVNSHAAPREGDEHHRIRRRSEDTGRLPSSDRYERRRTTREKSEPGGEGAYDEEKRGSQKRRSQYS